MAVRTAQSSGAWNDVARWDGGTTLPQTGDEVRSNGYTVSIDIDLNAYNFTSINTTGGGGFTCAIACTINSALITSNANSTICITTSHSSGTTVTINGNLTCDTGGSTRIPVSHTGTGTLVINGDVTGYNQGSRDYNDGLRITSTGIVNITGNVSCAGSGGGYTGCGIKVSGACTLNITGDVTGSTTAVGTNAIGIYSSGSGATINITGNVQGGNSVSSFGISLAAAQTVSITGNVAAKNASAINSTSAVVVTVIGNITYQTAPSSIVAAINLTTGTLCWSGTITQSSSQLAVVVYKMILLSTAGQTWTFVNNAAGTKNLYSADIPALGNPAVTDVRAGTTFGPASELTGTMAVPTADKVLLGVPNDKTVGTLIMTPAGFWGYARSSLTTANSIGKYLKNAATIDSTGDQITYLT